MRAMFSPVGVFLFLAVQGDCEVRFGGGRQPVDAVEKGAAVARASGRGG